MTEVEALAKYATRASFADLSPFGRPIRDIRQPGASIPIELDRGRGLRRRVPP